MFERSNQNWKKRRRVREVSYEKAEEVKRMFKYSDKELANLLNISVSQLSNYKQTYSLPASRYYGVKDALLLSLEDEFRDRRQQIMSLFS